MLRYTKEMSLFNFLIDPKCFVDFEKAFDRVKHMLLSEKLRELVVDLADLRVPTDLYWEQKAMVKCGEDRR